jgi:GH15 family glucan-1,4-alpha-glucosidase
MKGEFLPIADYGLISDGSAMALVSAAGSIDWCCMPRLDHGSSFGRILDPGAGHCSLTPSDPAAQSTRKYADGTMVLETTFTASQGEATLTDLFLLRDDGEPETPVLVRILEVTDGRMDFRFDLRPRFDYGSVDPWIRRHAPRLCSATGGDDALVIWSSAELRIEGRHSLAADLGLAEGERFVLSMRSCRPEQLDEEPLVAASGGEIEEAVARSCEAWRSWSERLRHPGPDTEGLRRSALVLRALTYRQTGAVAAAATTSLPEGLGATGERNWDYRFSWIRDSTLAVRSLARLGFEEEADAFRHFIERSAAGNADDLQVLYGVGGERRLPELELDHLAGYRGATPVRVGNGASSQLQLDAYGLVLDQTWRWCERGHEVDEDLWAFLKDLVESAIERWREPDCGFWEARNPRRFTHSRALCWAAADRGLRIAAAEGIEAPRERWERKRLEIQTAIEELGVDHERGVFVRDFDSKELDAAMLRLPIVNFCEWDDPRMLRTADAIEEQLGFGGLVRRYDGDDGFDVPEGAFLACSFWLCECLARQGRSKRARAVFDRARETANDLGLYSAEYAPVAGEMLGNFPQALTHLSHLEAAVALAEAPP